MTVNVFVFCFVLTPFIEATKYIVKTEGTKQQRSIEANCASVDNE